MNPGFLFTIAVLAWLLPSVAANGAAIVRCTLADGQIEYRKPPCPGGGGREIEIRNERLGTVVPVPVSRKHKKHERKPSRRKSSRRTANGKTAAERAREERCWKKRRALEKVENRLRHGYRASESVKLRARRDVYEDYIRRFCGDRGR